MEVKDHFIQPFILSGENIVIAQSRHSDSFLSHKDLKYYYMNEEKKDILDFFFDGDIIIAGAQGYTNISKILETGKLYVRYK